MRRGRLSNIVARARQSPASDSVGQRHARPCADRRVQLHDA